MKKIAAMLLCAGAYHPVLGAKALSPVEVYEQVQGSVAVLEQLDEAGKPTLGLTAIAISPEQAVTMCDGLGGKNSLRIVTGKKSVTATIRARDSQRHLCLLSAPGADMTAIAAVDAHSAIQSGTRVFAISNALGLGIGISEGVVSGIRAQLGTDYIQFSAPVSPGSDGGALVDNEARLLGVISYRHRDGQNVNFAVPAKWLAEIEQHAQSDSAYQQFREVAEQLRKDAQWQKLAEHTQQWLNLHQDDTDGWRLSALAAEKLGSLDAEENAWRKLRELEPASAIAGAGLVSVKLKRKQGPEALQLARELLILRREDAEIWTIVGQTEQVAGTAAKAEEAYRQALSFNPWQIAAYQGLIALAEQRNDRRTVTQLWQRWAALNPDAIDVQYRLADAYIRENRPKRAYSLLEKLVVPDEHKASLAFMKGQALAALSRPLDAVRALQSALQGEPKAHDWVWASLGHQYFELQRFPESIKAYKEAIRLNPNIDEWQYELALSLKDGGRAAEALEVNEQLLKKYPNESRIWRQKGFAENIAGRNQDSIKSLEKSLELNPNQGKVWAALIDVYHQVGRDSDVKIAYEKLRGIDSQYAEIAYRSAILPFEGSQP